MNRKHRTPALLLCLCTLLTAGCSRGGGEAAKEENVSYSQTLYPGMEMSAEQKNAVRAVEEMLSRATLDVTDERLTMTNTTGFPLTGGVTIRHYDKDGVYVGESNVDMDEWPAGAQMRVVARRDYTGGSRYEKADIGAEFVLGGSYVATNYLPVDMDSGKDRVSLMREVNRLAGRIARTDLIYREEDVQELKDLMNVQEPDCSRIIWVAEHLVEC